jgi:ubiquinone/menaquinone biosynthesis C-methylase UbiE
MGEIVAGRQRPDYGLDAPGTVRSLFLASCIGFIALITGLMGLWSPRHPVALLMFPLCYAGPALLVTGLFMIWWSRSGKVRARERYLDRLPWRGDETVLDIGCGRGLFLVAAAKRLHRGGKAVGIDLWNAEDLAGNSADGVLANAQLEGVADRVEVKTGDARKLDFADGTFDTVVSSVALHNIEGASERRNAAFEIARVLKPGGRVLIVDIRHTGEYADVLRGQGVPDARATRSALSYLATVLTFGALRAGVVMGRKTPLPY